MFRIHRLFIYYLLVSRIYYHDCFMWEEFSMIMGLKKGTLILKLASGSKEITAFILLKLLFRGIVIFTIITFIANSTPKP